MKVIMGAQRSFVVLMALPTEAHGGLVIVPFENSYFVIKIQFHLHSFFNLIVYL